MRTLNDPKAEACRARTDPSHWFWRRLTDSTSKSGNYDEIWTLRSSAWLGKDDLVNCYGYGAPFGVAARDNRAESRENATTPFRRTRFWIASPLSMPKVQDRRYFGALYLFTDLTAARSKLGSQRLFVELNITAEGTANRVQRTLVAEMTALSGRKIAVFELDKDIMRNVVLRARIQGKPLVFELYVGAAPTPSESASRAPPRDSQLLLPLNAWSDIAGYCDCVTLYALARASVFFWRVIVGVDPCSLIRCRYGGDAKSNGEGLIAKRVIYALGDVGDPMRARRLLDETGAVFSSRRLALITQSGFDKARLTSSGNCARIVTPQGFWGKWREFLVQEGFVKHGDIWYRKAGEPNSPSWMVHLFAVDPARQAPAEVVRRGAIATSDLVWVTGGEIFIAFPTWFIGKRLVMLRKREEASKIAEAMRAFVTVRGFLHPREESGASIWRNRLPDEVDNVQERDPTVIPW